MKIKTMLFNNTNFNLEFFGDARYWFGNSGRSLILTLRLRFYYLITDLSNMNTIGFYQYVGYRGLSLFNLPCNYNSKYLIPFGDSRLGSLIGIPLWGIDKLTILIFRRVWALIDIIPMICGDSILLQNIIFLVQTPVAVIMLIYLALLLYLLPLANKNNFMLSLYGCFAAPFYPSQNQLAAIPKFSLKQIKGLRGPVRAKPVMNFMQVRGIAGCSVSEISQSDIAHSETLNLLRKLSSLNQNNQMVEGEFFEWLAGFTDAEGTFYVGVSGLNKKVSLRFKIGLHLDDLPVLEFIVSRLGFGKIYIHKNSAELVIYKQDDIRRIIEIFQKYPLQSTKWLNFSEFSECFKLISEKVGDSVDIKKKIIGIKNKMNNSRTNYELPATKIMHISKYWLLGFIEGEGSFTVTKINRYQLFFSLSQAGYNLPLMQGIQNFLENLAATNNLFRGVFKVTPLKTLDSKHKPAHRVKISNSNYFRDSLIPLLLPLHWVSKKRYDFYDWVMIFLLKEKGHHYTENGQKLIELFLSQMNNNRLSTRVSVKANTGEAGTNDLSRTQLIAEAIKLLDGSSNYETRDGVKFVVSDNKPIIPVHRSKVGVDVVDSESGNILQTFESYHECASFFGVTHPAISYRIKQKSTFRANQFNDKLVFVRRI